MATNPIYEGNSFVYECLPEMRDLKSVSEQPIHHPTSMYLEIPHKLFRKDYKFTLEARQYSIIYHNIHYLISIPIKHKS